MRHIADVLSEHLGNLSGPPGREVATRSSNGIGRVASLPHPVDASHEDRLALAAELERGERYELAFHYLAVEAYQRPSAYLWRRLGGLCHRLAWIPEAIWCFRQSLETEPQSSYGAVGLAKSVADDFDAASEELASVAVGLTPHLDGTSGGPARWTLVKVLRVLARRDPRLIQTAVDAEAFARDFGTYTPTALAEALALREADAARVRGLLGGGIAPPRSRPTRLSAAKLAGLLPPAEGDAHV